MMDIHAGSLNLGEILMFLVIPLTFVVQLLLCFRVKSLIIRLIPSAIFAVITALLFIGAITAGGWEGIGYLILAVWAAVLLAACLIPWGIYLICKLIKKIIAQGDSPEDL